MEPVTMKKDVIISIRSSQHNGKDMDSMELVTEGRFYKQGEHYFISYKESELTGMDGRTTLRVDPKDQTISMTRSGDHATHMMFQMQQTHCTHYDTGCGSLDMGVTTRRLDIKVEEALCLAHLRVKYILDIGNRYVSTNTIEFKIKEAQPPHGKHDSSYKGTN